MQLPFDRLRLPFNDHRTCHIGLWQNIISFNQIQSAWDRWLQLQRSKFEMLSVGHSIAVLYGVTSVQPTLEKVSLFKGNYWFQSIHPLPTCSLTFTLFSLGNQVFLSLQISYHLSTSFSRKVQFVWNHLVLEIIIFIVFVSVIGCEHHCNWEKSKRAKTERVRSWLGCQTYQVQPKKLNLKQS